MGLSDPLPFNGYKKLCILSKISQHTPEVSALSQLKNLKFFPFVITADHLCSHLIHTQKSLRL